MIRNVEIGSLRAHILHNLPLSLYLLPQTPTYRAEILKPEPPLAVPKPQPLADDIDHCILGRQKTVPR